MNKSDLDRVIEIVLIDAYCEEEETVAWETVLKDVIDVPTQAELLGRTATVTEIGPSPGHTEVTASCQRPHGTRGDVAFADLAFPPDSEAA
jgi:hypothetical protein